MTKRIEILVAGEWLSVLTTSSEKAIETARKLWASKGISMRVVSL